jgi:hypothetical protein
VNFAGEPKAILPARGVSPVLHRTPRRWPPKGAACMPACELTEELRGLTTRNLARIQGAESLPTTATLRFNAKSRSEWGLVVGSPAASR